MPTFDPRTQVDRHKTHCLVGCWVGGCQWPLFYCSQCFLKAGDPLILEACVLRPHRKVVDAWLGGDLLPDNALASEPADDAMRTGACGLAVFFGVPHEERRHGRALSSAHVKWLGDVAQGDRDMAERL